MNIALTNGSQSISQISASQPGVVSVQVANGQGQPVVNRVVQFSSTLGTFTPASATALTDSTGTATILLNAGTIEGAGEVTATFEGVSVATGFYTLGDEIDASQLEAAISFDILNCPANWDRAARDPSECTQTSNISPSQPGILFIQVTRAGTNQPLADVLVQAETTLGKISPDSRTAITNADGIALLDLLANSEVGAGSITVTALDTSVSRAFQIGAADVTLSIDNGLASGQTLSAGSTTVLKVSIFESDSGDLYQPPVEVQFSSACSASGQAVLDDKVISVGGVASATYRASGCVGDDQVTATAIVGGEALTISTVITVEEAATGSIQFISATPDNLALKGSGGLQNDGVTPRSETAVVVFKVLDANGNPDPQELVRFSLSTDVGGITLSPLEASTDNNGLVQTVVTAGRVPTSVRVIAIHGAADGNPDNATNRISAVSDFLTISTGVADQNSFTVSLSKFRPQALNHTGDTTDPEHFASAGVTAYLADHFNNPVPDGTTVYFTTEGGAIEPSCQTVNGACSVVWRSQAPVPFADAGYNNTVFSTPADVNSCFTDYNGDGVKDANERYALCLPGEMTGRFPAGSAPARGGRATITVTAVGEESFTDLNGNGLFDTGEFFRLTQDLSEAFTDHNEDGLFRDCGVDAAAADCNVDPIDNNLPLAQHQGWEFEEFFDFNANGLFDKADGKYNGLLCSEAAQQNGDCSWELTHIRRNIELVMSGELADARFRSACDLNSDGVADGTGQCDVTGLYVIKGSTNGGVLYVADLFNNQLPSGTQVEVSTDIGSISGQTNFTLPDGNYFGPSSIPFTVKIQADEQENTGTLTVTFTYPNGASEAVSLPITAITPSP